MARALPWTSRRSAAMLPTLVPPQDIFWLTQPASFPQNSPMAVYGDDLRADNRCPAAFQLKRSQLTSTGDYGTVFGYVIEGDNHKPEGGDGMVACFSNCGKYKFPLEPQFEPGTTNCKSPTDPTTCSNWKTFCAPTGELYGQSCNTDADCEKYGVHAACWINPGSEVDHTCQLRAFNQANSVPPTSAPFRTTTLIPTRK